MMKVEMEREATKVPETPGGGWRVWCERTSASQFGTATAVLKRGGRYDKGSKPWTWIDGHEAEFDEAGARKEAARLSAKAEEDQKLSFGVGGRRRYSAEPIA
jgi:hypothetical protein